MSQLNILTWNTRLYEYGNTLGNSVKPIQDELVNSIINYIKGFIEKENSVAILQEIPFCNNIDWKTHKIYGEIQKEFPEDKYQIEKTVHTEKQILMTLAIAKKGLIKKDEDGFNDNRCISILNNSLNLKILGIHAKNNEGTKKYLDLIKERYGCYYDLIIGDFNSGNYCKEKESLEFIENRKSFIQFSEGYIDACQGIVTTQYGTQIDHVLIRNTHRISKTDYKIEVMDGIKLSDHYPIWLKLKLIESSKV